MKTPDHQDEFEQHQDAEAEWTERDRAELWQSIREDPCIDPDNWEAAFRAALRGDPQWYDATAAERENEAHEQATQQQRGGLCSSTFPGCDHRHQVTVGWDRGLETFFAQVWEPRTADLLHWAGSNRGEVPSVDLLAALVHRYGNIPHATLDRLQEASQRREPIQKATEPVSGQTGPSETVPQNVTRSPEQDVVPLQRRQSKLTQEL